MVRNILLVIGIIILIILIIFLVDLFLLESTIGKQITKNPCLILNEMDCKQDNLCEPNYGQPQFEAPVSERKNTSTYQGCQQKNNWSLILDWLNRKKIKKAF